MNFNSKCTSMRRFYISISAILFLVACSPNLSVHQISTKDISCNNRTSAVDSLVQFMEEPYLDCIEHDMSKLIAVSATSLVKDNPESKLIILVSDILQVYQTEYCKIKNLSIIPDASYVNYGGIRTSLPQGEIRVGHILRLMLFENEIDLIKISGESIQKMTERFASRGGERVADLILGNRNAKSSTLKIGWKTVESGSLYWLVTSDYITNGGDQMSMFSNLVDRINTKMKIRDILNQAFCDRYKKDGIILV